MTAHADRVDAVNCNGIHLAPARLHVTQLQWASQEGQRAHKHGCKLQGSKEQGNTGHPRPSMCCLLSLPQQTCGKRTAEGIEVRRPGETMDSATWRQPSILQEPMELIMRKHVHAVQAVELTHCCMVHLQAVMGRNTALRNCLDQEGKVGSTRRRGVVKSASCATSGATQGWESAPMLFALVSFRWGAYSEWREPRFAALMTGCNVTLFSFFLGTECIYKASERTHTCPLCRQAIDEIILLNVRGAIRAHARAHALATP